MFRNLSIEKIIIILDNSTIDIILDNSTIDINLFLSQKFYYYF